MNLGRAGVLRGEQIRVIPTEPEKNNIRKGPNVEIWLKSHSHRELQIKILKHSIVGTR